MNFERSFIMQLPQTMEVKGIRVLTSKQIADMHGTKIMLDNVARYDI